MTLYQIIKSLQNADGTLAKQAIMDANKDNALFKVYMKAVYDVSLNYYQKKLPKPTVHSYTTKNNSITHAEITLLVNMLSGRKITGNGAKKFLADMLGNTNEEGQELIGYIINRKIGANVGDTMVLKTWPDLYFIPPYQRCSLLDEKAKERFRKLDKMYVQRKADGSFAYGYKGLDGTCKLITRAGSIYPITFAEKVLEDSPNGSVFIGELEVWEMDYPTEKLLDRKTGNGILNSILKDGDGLAINQNVAMVAWDMLTVAEFEAGKSSSKLEQRFTDMVKTMLQVKMPNIDLIDHEEVSSLSQAMDIYTGYTKRGLEGAILKDPNSLWKDGTAKDIVKLKIKFDAEYRCTGIYEGEGKAKGMMGGANFETEDGEIVFNVGTGFDDKQRKEFWDNPDLIVQKVCMLSANDVIQSRDTRKKLALSLPAFEEIRHDKTVANTKAEVEAILAAARAGAI